MKFLLCMAVVLVIAGCQWEEAQPPPVVSTCSSRETNIPVGYRSSVEETWEYIADRFDSRTMTDYIVEGNGRVRFCVRWDTTAYAVSTITRDRIGDELEERINAWYSHLYEYHSWPYSWISVSVTGWATNDRNLFLWEDGESAPITVRYTPDGDSVPHCADSTSFDISLKITDSLPAPSTVNPGATTLALGSPRQVSFYPSYFLTGFDSSERRLLEHELGHAIGFPDYYHWDPSTGDPYSVMVSGASIGVSEWDGWALRYVWDQIHCRFDL